jgi:hypothetical protein
LASEMLKDEVVLQLGQQQPKIAVLAPASQACREVEESRVVAWVHRMLRKKQSKLARGGDASTSSTRPSVSFKVLLPPVPTPLSHPLCGLVAGRPKELSLHASRFVVHWHKVSDAIRSNIQDMFRPPRICVRILVGGVLLCQSLAEC